jgi:hypothetical protein
MDAEGKQYLLDACTAYLKIHTPMTAERKEYIADRHIFIQDRADKYREELGESNLPNHPTTWGLRPAIIKLSYAKAKLDWAKIRGETTDFLEASLQSAEKDYKDAFCVYEQMILPMESPEHSDE